MLPNADDNGLTAFHYACHYNNSAILSYLLSISPKGSQARSKRGYTPFHTCALSGSSECLRVLLLHDSTAVDFQNEWGETALHLAAQSGSVVCFDLLLPCASANIRDKWDRLPSDVAKVGRKQNKIYLTSLFSSFSKGVLPRSAGDDPKTAGRCCESNEKLVQVAGISFG